MISTDLLVAIIVSASLFVAAAFYLYRSRRTTKISEIRLLGGRYNVGYELGRGMNAITYKVQEKYNEKHPVVAKVLLTPQDEPRITPSSFRRHADRFQREMRNLESLQNSKYVVPVHSFHPEALRPFYVMEYCEISLEKELKNRLPKMEKTLEIIIDICRGLAYIHAKDIIHRDLKPANILRYQGRWVLADFGMSLIGNEGSIVTVPESLPGTIPYTAPEVMYYPPSTIGPAADVFSLGVTIKEMLTGSSNWQGRPSQLVSHGDKTRIEQVGFFDDLVVEMMNLRPEERPATVRDVGQKLAMIFKQIGIKGHEKLQDL
jgi:serine/threonine protein kinase